MAAVEANFVPYPVGPLTGRPTIAISSPLQDTVCADSLNLTFSVDRPDSWVTPIRGGDPINAGVINAVSYILDGNETFLPVAQLTYLSDELPKSQRFSLILDDVPMGAHNLTVAVKAKTNYYTNSSPWSLTNDEIDVSQTVLFTTEPPPSLPEFPVWMAFSLIATAITLTIVFIRKKSVPKKFQL